MRRPGLFVRLRARARRSERGFTLIETVIAITVIFAALTALAYAATNGFGYQALSRERQAASAIADKIMEDARGLAYAKIQKGLSSLDNLSADPNLKTGCAGDPAGTYRLMSCTGDVVVVTPNLALSPPTPPLVPHTGTISSGYPTTYSWSVYVTNNCPNGTEPGCVAANMLLHPEICKTGAELACKARTPYQVTVIVSWTGGRVNGVARSVTMKTLFWSPNGCVSNQTHPYAAPCQPFFFGQAQLPRGAVSISGSIQGLSFSSAELDTTAAESDGQQEQFSAAQGAYLQSGVVYVDGGGNRQTRGGTAAVTAAANTDPSGTIDPWDRQTLASGIGGSISQFQGWTGFTVSAPNGDTAETDAATSAGASQPCPPWIPKQTDQAVCSGSQIKQGGSLTATADFTNIQGSIDLGTASMATIASSGSYNTTSVDRTPGSGQDGTLVSSVVRSLGTVNLVGLPTGLNPSAYPIGWSQYLVSMTGYADRVTATVGTGAPVPSGSVTSGSIMYWNGTGYSTAAPGTTITPAPVTVVDTINGHTVQIDVTSSPLVGATFTSTSTALSGTPSALGDADAEMSGPLTGTITYRVVIDGDFDHPVVDLTIKVALGSTVARGIYQRAPSAG